MRVGLVAMVVVTGAALTSLALTQEIDGNTLNCESVEQTAGYTACSGITVGPLAGFANGVECGPGWRSNLALPEWDPQGFCLVRTGSPNYEVFVECGSSMQRATWNDLVWGAVLDDSLVSALRCHYP